MPLTREFKETIARRAKEDTEFRYQLLCNAISEFLAGDLAMAKILLRDYINANPRFETIAKEMNKDPKSIQRMLGPHGNPTAANLSSMIKSIQKLEKVKLEVRIH